MIRKILHSLRRRKGLLIIITAAMLMELLSGAQYFFTHRVIEDELEKRAESELTLKAILIKNNLNEAEVILKYNMWFIQEQLDEPDSAYGIVKRMVTLSPRIKGAAIAFKPDYYPEKGKWFEVYARRNADGKVVDEQIGGPGHDYTNLKFYTGAQTAENGFWVEPYTDAEGAQDMITSFARPVYDRQGRIVAVTAVDIPLKWLSDTIDRRHIYPSSFLIVMNESGDLVISPSEERVKPETTDYIYRLIADSTVTRRTSTSGRTTVIHFDTDKRDGTIFYANMKGKPHWQIAVVCYDDEVYAALSRLRIRLLLMSLLAFSVLLFLVWRFAHNMKKLEQKTLEQQRMDGELRIASGIQHALLPDDEPTLKGIGDVQVEGRLIPAKAVGGDLYNAFVRDGKLFFCIGDVSGKGVPASIVMATVQTLFRNIASRNNNPAQIIEQLNESGCRNNRANMFITMFIGVLDLPTGHLRYCNAGHNMPLIVRDGSCRYLDAKPNLPIGLFDDFRYEMQELTMEPGSALFLYTDGLTEARDMHRRMFGEKRLMQLIAESGTTDAKLLVDTAIAQVTRFAEGTEQGDDLTLLVIKYQPEEEHLIFDETLTLYNDVKEVAALGTFIKDVAARLDIGRPLASKLRLALEEAVVNVMEYAYPARTRGDVTIRVSSDGRQLKFIITDAGISFNPTEAAAADTTLSAEERPVGGLGILLVRELMDSINYERTGGKNVLTLTKELSSGRSADI